MNAISAPWRMDYIKSEKTSDCVLCVGEGSTCQAYILKKGAHALAMMNLYPYSTGHIMVVPHRHVGLMEDLTKEERSDISDLTVLCVKVLKRAMNPEGFNIGINLGSAAGAGVAEHLHVHIVPRWSGDTNFMSTVGDVRVIPQDVAKTWEILVSHFNQVDGEES